MTLVAFIRHGDTDWNRRGLIQGSSDIGLDDAGRALVGGWRVPDALAEFEWLSSPLKRARETACILSGREPASDPRLAEMCWGAWEGRTIPDLRAELGDLMKAWEARGLDFCGPGGESPRQVQARVSSLLAELGSAGKPVIAVSHRGVIRAVYALATGWDMVGRPAERLSDDCVQVFKLDEAARPSIHSLNVPLATP
jgi:probable phosphoglycerate mutase